MLYQKKGDTVLAGSKMFTVGGEVFANHTCDYGGLFGTNGNPHRAGPVYGAG